MIPSRSPFAQLVRLTSRNGQKTMALDLSERPRPQDDPNVPRTGPTLRQFLRRKER